MVHVNNIQHNTLENIFTKYRSKNFNEDQFVISFKEAFGINYKDKLPSEFDAWNVRKQCDWINQNITIFFPNVPQSLLNFVPASFCSLSYHDRSLEELPEWMDIDKYRRAQKFMKKHYTAIVISKVIGLMYVYSFDDGLRTAAMGQHAHTPYLGFQKYVGTIKRILSWYNGDPWIKGTKAYKDMQATRRKHLAIRRKLQRLDHEQIVAACTFANPWCPDRELLLKDFAAACQSEKTGQRPYIIFEKSPFRPKGINNADLSVVQSSFIVILLFRPQIIGIHDATDEDLEAFCHMWKCYGYFLGIEDEYNLCRGNLEEIKQRVSDLYQYWIIQNFKQMSPEWEHVTRCIVEPLNYYPLIYMPYRVMMLLATDALNLNMPHLYASLKYTEWITYKIYKFIFYTMKFKTIRAIANKLAYRIIDSAINFDEEKLAEIHEKSKKILPDFSLM